MRRGIRNRRRINKEEEIEKEEFMSRIRGERNIVAGRKIEVKVEFSISMKISKFIHHKELLSTFQSPIYHLNIYNEMKSFETLNISHKIHVYLCNLS